MPYCSNCGLKLNKSANFCPKCGKKIVRSYSDRGTRDGKNRAVPKQQTYPAPKILYNFGKVGENLTFAFVRFNNDMYDLRYWQRDGTPVRGIRFDMAFIQSALAALRGKELNTLLAVSENFITYKNANNESAAKIYKILCSTPVQGWDGWNTELSVIAWSNSAQGATFDLRQWKTDHSAPRKRHGLTLSATELAQLLAHFETATVAAL